MDQATPSQTLLSGDLTMMESRCCRICLSPELSEPIVVREMMYGTRESFDYEQCSACGSLQIVTIPEDIGRFYANGYYSMSRGLDQRASVADRLRDLMKRQRDLHCLGQVNLFGRTIAKTHPPAPALQGIAAARPRRSSRILDVGCGEAAIFLRQLAELGFTNLLGADPFMAVEAQGVGPVRLTRSGLDELDGPFDVITLNHSFEHMPDPRAAMGQIRRLLAANGTCVLRVPTPSCYAFEHYGAEWVQLDAPRHLNLASRRGIAVLAEAQGLRVVRSFDDSGAFQFFGSELIRRDIPFAGDEADDAFGLDEIARYDAQARALNEQDRGDQTVFLLQPSE